MTKPACTLFILIAFCSSFSNAQDSLRPVPYSPLREADVMWCKRIWRSIDLREKMNQPLYYPVDSTKDRVSLSQLLYNAVLVNGTLTAYEDDEFKKVLPGAELAALFHKKDTVWIDDPDHPGTLLPKVLLNELNLDNITQYRIKEEWFFDKQRSVMDVRIIGLCPVVDVCEENGNRKGLRPLFWVYYPQARPLLAGSLAFNRFNDEEERTFDQVFCKRLFESHIIKESNVYDRSVSEYKTGMDALLESEMIEHRVFEWENALWEH